MSIGDERGVSARLEALEAAQRAGMDEMRRMVAGMARGAMPAAAPDIVVTGPPGYAAVASAPAQQEFFGRVTRVAGRSATQGQAARPRTPSLKRVREGEGEGQWREVPPRRKQRLRAKAVVGTAVLDGYSDLARPEQFWVGNTSPDTTADSVKEVLGKCAGGLNVEDFKIIDVTTLNKETNPMSRSWRVTVPARLKDLMLNPAMYPLGWGGRVFHPGGRRQEAAGQGASVVTGAADLNAW